MRASADSRRLARAARHLRLSPRQIQVATRLLDGRSIPQTARELEISPNTVKAHLERIYRSLGINSRLGLADAALEAEENREP